MPCQRRDYHCPGLGDLPGPPAGKNGWPWTLGSTPLPDAMPDGKAWPRITIVTPSYNQRPFIEETIRSILLQGYPNLEYLVMDGGSTDGSVEIIKKYAPWINYWVSEPDGGQSAAINRGLAMGTGVFATWINSDDMLYPNALSVHATRAGFDERIVYVGICAYMDVGGNILSMHRSRILTLEDLLSIPRIWRQGGNIVQPEVLFSRALALRVGALDAGNHYTMDYELWGKFLLAGACIQNTEIPFGMFRRHEEQKTANGIDLTQSLIGTAIKLIALADDLSTETKQTLLDDLQAYLADYPERHWRDTGRLAKAGLPHPIVARLRGGKQKLESVFRHWVLGHR